MMTLYALPHMYSVLVHYPLLIQALKERLHKQQEELKQRLEDAKASPGLW